VDVNIFTQNIPIQSSFVKDGKTYYSLFDNYTVLALLKYSVYSVFTEFMQASDNRDLLQVVVRENHRQRLEKIAEAADESNAMMGGETVIDKDLVDQEMDLMEVQLVGAKEKELKERVCAMLCAFVRIEQKNKAAIQLSYTDIIKSVRRSREKEKRSIVEAFGKQTIEERRVENTLKTYKMERWNVGMQKGLIYYDAETNRREKDEFVSQIVQDMTGGAMDDITELMVDIYNINKPDEADETENTEPYNPTEGEEERTYDRDGFGIDPNLGADYQDGVFYDEDREDPEFEF
jgi:hypothetical protein